MPPRGASAAKRARLEAAAAAPPPPLPSPLNAELFTTDSRAALRAAYAAAQPFPHAVLRPLCDDARLRAAFAEMRDELSGTFKETDLFKARPGASAAPRSRAAAFTLPHPRWQARAAAAAPAGTLTLPPRLLLLR